MTTIGPPRTVDHPAVPSSATTPPLRSVGVLRSLGVEEEFHLVDLASRRVTPQAADLLRALDGGPFVPEMNSSMIETNTDVVVRLPELHQELLARRTTLRRAARDLGLGVLAAGTAPLLGPTAPPVTDRARYRWMRSQYGVLADEQLICGTQVHVELPDRDEALAVAELVAPYLPVLLALSASSPYDARGHDTGYASSRSLVWSRWPTTGLTSGATTAGEYDALIAELARAGVALDEGMMYFDIRPALVAPTLELRICDSCPSVDTIVLIAGLFRALVDRAVAARQAGAVAEPRSPVLARAAVWRAARSGLSGDLMDPVTGFPRPARDVVTDLVQLLEPQLRRTEDWSYVRGLARATLASGSSADRQRRAYAVRGRLADVVDQVLAETASAGQIGMPGTTTVTGAPNPGADPTNAADLSVGQPGPVVAYGCPVGCGRFDVVIPATDAPTLFRCPRCGGPATRAAAGEPAALREVPGSAPGRFGWRPRPPERHPSATH